MASDANTSPARPALGRIVIYRSRDRVDMPAIVTGFPPQGEPTDVYLQLFVPPGASPDHPSHEWGVALAPDPADALPGTWRWPERVG